MCIRDRAKTGLFVGDNSKTAYEAYLLANSAIGAGSAYVTLYASAGSMGYVDAAKKTTSVVGTDKPYTVPSANVRTDISNIKYGAPVVYVYTTSTTDKTLHGLYVYPMTSLSLIHIFVGAVVRHGDDVALGQLVEAGLAAAVDAHGLVVDGGGGDELGAVLGVEVQQVGLVLEVVRVELAVGEGEVRHDVVVEDLDLKLIAQGLKLTLDGLKDLGVGRAGRADDELFELGGSLAGRCV